ncbi:MAG: hypothetical protein R3B06_15990 [Kofleriaceae bacterium]
MRARTLVAAIIGAGFAGGGILYAQPAPAGGTPAPGAPAPVDPAADPTADVSLPSEKDANLSPQEMATNADRLIGEMEATHRHTLELQASAKQAKDVIKLNCVNENLLAVKQLLNIADEAKTNFTGAKVQGDRSEMVHQFGQITIASEKSKEAGAEAQACIGEELYFLGKNDVEVTGPDVKHDPTKDGDVGNSSGEDSFEVGLEDPAYASPFAPL